MSERIPRNVEEIVISPEKKKLRKVLKMEHQKISKLLNDSTVPKFVKRKLTEWTTFCQQEYEF